MNTIEHERIQFFERGTASSPYLAVHTLQQVAKDEAGNFPNAFNFVILSDFYVDVDVASGADTTEEAIKLRNELKNALRTGGINLRKWASNSNELMAIIPETERGIEYPLNVNTKYNQKIGHQVASNE